MLSEFEFAAFSNYHSYASSDAAKKSRKLCGAIKSGRTNTLAAMSSRLLQDDVDSISAFIGSDRHLVPMPGSGKTTPGNLWGPKLICDTLHSNGMGAGVLTMLERRNAVPKSAFAAPGERPTVQTHFDSMAAHADLTTPTKITLVDDVLTKGSTMMGAARRIWSVLPNADIVGFAVFRTRNLDPDITSVVEPVIGTLRYSEDTDEVFRID